MSQPLPAPKANEKQGLAIAGLVCGMGGTAYGVLSEMENNRTNKIVYEELSGKSQPFSNVLGEMSERSGVQSNKDILRLYERWMATGSDRLRKILSDHGIQPVSQSKTIKQ